jgi:hypothetical protein
MATFKTCDGVKRRDFMRIGALTGFGLTSTQFLRLVQAAPQKQPRAQAAIYIRLSGGPTHMDTFDLKPDAPEEYRGQLKPIKTNVDGMEISELLPNLAKVADKFTILRGVSHTLAAHELGTKYTLTGNRPLPSLEFPVMGSVVSKVLPSPSDMPSFVAVPRLEQGAGYLGLQYGPFATNAVPKAKENFNVRGMSMQGGLTLTDIARREKLLASVDTTFREIEKSSEVLSGLDGFSEQAYNLITNKRAREAFDTGREKAAIHDRFGSTEVGQSALLAARLVEAGARFVTINTGGWDMHQDIYKNLGTRLPPVDQALAGLLTTLEERGLLESTAVILTGEFGRTPKINQRGGRDHWPRAMFMVMAGGGMKTGQVIGASDDKGQGPAGEAITPGDVAASLFYALGIDHHKEFQTHTGRPIMVVREGNVIPALFG